MSVLGTLLVGAAGALIAEFLVRPILRFRELRSRIISDIVYFANVPAPTRTKEGSERYWERVDANRRTGADLMAWWYVSFPSWVRGCLLKLWRLPWFRGFDPMGAASELIGLSNEDSWDGVRERVERIREYLRIPRIT